MKARKLTLALAALVSVGVASIAAAAAFTAQLGTRSRRLGERDHGLRRVEQGDRVPRASRGDLKLNHCARGYTKLSANIDGADGRPRRYRCAGPAGRRRAAGRARRPAGRRLRCDRCDRCEGETGATGPAGPAGPAGSNGPKGDKGDKGDPAPTLLRLTGDFSGTNASVATSLDGVQFGPYPNGGQWGGSVLVRRG